MKQRMISIPEREYRRLKEFELVDKELLKDIAEGIRSIIGGKIKEV